MKSYVAQIQNLYQSTLERAASEYLKVGLALFHEQRRTKDYQQTSLGNLTIAIELTLKTIIANKNLAMLFKDLPVELRFLLTTPEGLPSSFNWRTFDSDLRSPKYKTLEFDECVSVFYLLFPHLRKELQTHLKHLSSYRNASVHFILPLLHKYETERAAYIALRIHDVLNREVAPSSYSLLEEDSSFLKLFREERLERVRKEIEAAKEASKKLENRQLTTEIDSWDSMITKCPVCGNDAVLGGYSDLKTVSVNDDIGGEAPVGLKFRASGFYCPHCELTLDDDDELLLAGIPTEYERKEEEMNAYLEDSDTYPYSR